MVKTALIKDGWVITHDPYPIKYAKTELYADLAAQKTLVAERDGQKIVVEVKNFVGRSPYLNEFDCWCTIMMVTKHIFLSKKNKFF